MTSVVKTVAAHDHHGCSHSHHDDDAPAVEFSLSDASPCSDSHECHESNCLYVKAPSPAPIEDYACTIGLLVDVASIKTHCGIHAFTRDSLRPHYDAGCNSAPALCAQLQSWQI